MPRSIFPPATREAFAAAYPATPIKLAHSLLGHDLLTIDALANLAEALPAHEIEYNPGQLPIGIRPEDVPKSALSVGETIRRIGQSDSWVVLKRIEQVPAYRDFLNAILDQLKDIVEPRTGAMMQMEGFIFISSPGAVTPFHFDPEHNILLQVRGSKVMTVFPVEDEAMLSAQAHEDFHLGLHHRNLTWSDGFAEHGTPFALRAGEAIHVPVKAPHWVRNGDEPSISLSITWRSDWSYAEADARALNHLLRKVGLRPASPAPFPARNRGKALAWRVIRKLRGVA
jgi:hypothetical protein